MDARNIVLQPIKALKLAPGDLLIVHSCKDLDAVSRRKLEHALTEQFWGQPNKYLILEGKFDLATLTKKTK